MTAPDTSSRWQTVTLTCAAAGLLLYLVALTHWINLHRMFWVDAILGWYYYTDPTWAHMMKNWVAGREGSGYLFDLLARAIVRVFGESHLNAIRYYSSICIGIAFILWTATLRRVFQSAAVILPCALLWFADPNYLFHVGESRFYGQYIIGCVLAIAAAVWVEDGGVPAWQAFLLSFVSGTLLGGSQVLGIFWVGVVVTGQLLTRHLTRSKWASVAGFVMSLWQLVPYRSLFVTSKDLSNWWIRKPTLHMLGRVYLRAPVGGYALQAVLIALVVLAAFRLWASLKVSPLPARKRLLLTLLALFACGPIAFFAISRGFQSIFLPRYLLPTFIAFSGLAAWGVSDLVDRIDAHVSKWTLYAMTAVAFVAIAFLHVLALRNTAGSYDAFAELNGLVQISDVTPVLFEDMVLQEQLHLYRPQTASRFFVTLKAEQINGHKFLTDDLSYWPYYKEENAFLQANPHFILIQTAWSKEMNLDRYLSDPSWSATRLRDVQIGNRYSLPAWDLVRRP